MPTHGSLTKEKAMKYKLELNDFQLGFLVGMIEGEGTISAYQTGKRGNKSWSPALKISNTDLETMELVSKLLKQKNLCLP